MHEPPAYQTSSKIVTMLIYNTPYVYSSKQPDSFSGPKCSLLSWSVPFGELLTRLNASGH